MVLRTKHALPRNISWRSRLVWSRARDWKSRNRQKRFKSSNLFFSANQNLNRIRKCLIWVFLLQKFRFYWCFSVVSVPSFQPFRGSYGCVRIALSVAVADGFMPRKVLDVRKECVRLSCQRQTKSPSGCRLAVYLPTDTLLRGSRQEHRGINRLRMYYTRITSLKSLSP